MLVCVGLSVFGCKLLSVGVRACVCVCMCKCAPVYVCACECVWADICEYGEKES